MALLLLWEADHGVPFPTHGSTLGSRLQAFTRQLRAAVAHDLELLPWLTSRKMRFSLAPGLPPCLHVRWAVRIASAEVGPFLASWKAHLCALVRRRSYPLAVNDPQQKRQKREGQRGPKRQRVELSSPSSRPTRPRLAQQAAAGAEPMSGVVAGPVGDGALPPEAAVGLSRASSSAVT